MNDIEFLNQMKNLYDSLKYFSIENNRLILNYDKTYKMPLLNIKLKDLNQNLFLLDPKEIFQVIYMLELLPKKQLNDSEISFIEQYVTRYLLLNDKALEENGENANKVWGLSIPIYSSYDPVYINTPCSVIIQNTINNHSKELEKSGYDKQQRLVLTNPNFETFEEEDTLQYFEKAGFTTILLIASAVILTSLYIAFFIIGK